MSYGFTKDKLLELHYNQNLTTVEIAKLYNCNRDTVRLAMKRFDIEPRGMIKKPIDKDLLSLILDLYEETHSIRIVESKVKINRKKISEILKEHGIKVLSKTDNAKYTWKNHEHPRTGMTGEKCPMYGHKMSAETRAKLRPIWERTANERRVGKKKHSGGYILVYSPTHKFADRSGYVLEHRLIMEQILGRTLDENECIHHINGNKTDNRPENLMLTNKSEHAKIHMKQRYKSNA